MTRTTRTVGMVIRFIALLGPMTPLAAVTVAWSVAATSAVVAEGWEGLREGQWAAGAFVRLRGRR